MNVGLKEPPEGKWIALNAKNGKREQEEKRKRRGFNLQF